MSGASVGGGNFFKQQYDRVAIMATLVALLVSAALLIWRVTDDRIKLNQTNAGIAASGSATVETANLDDIREAAKELASPARVADRENRLLTSELRVFCAECGKAISFGAPQCPFCGKAQPTPTDDRDGDGMKDSFETKYALNPDNPDDAVMDPDGDGFSNLEEFLAGTHPRDAQSSPPVVAKLRIDQLRQDRFSLRFESVQNTGGGSEKYQLNAKHRTYFSRIGDKVEGYTLLRYDAANKMLFIQKEARTIGLPRGKDVIDDLITVKLLFLMDGSTFTARKDETFDLRGASYRLVDITTGRNPSIKLVDTASGREYLVNAVTDMERADAQSRMRTPFQAGPPQPSAINPGITPPPSAVTPRSSAPAVPGAPPANQFFVPPSSAAPPPGFTPR